MSETTLTNYNADADPDKIETIITLRGVRGRMTIDKGTGQSTFNSINSDGSTGNLLASSDGNAWEPTNSFTYAYNVANRSSSYAYDENLTSAAFQEDIFYNGQTTQNEDGNQVSTTGLMYQLNSTRQAELGAASNFRNAEDQEKAQQAAYDNNIPGGISGENETNSAGENIQTNNPEQFAPPEAVVKPASDSEGSSESTDDFNSLDESHIGPARDQKGNKDICYYPLNRAPAGLLDYIQFVVHEYEPPGLDTIGSLDDNFDYGYKDGKNMRLGESYETIQLPMVPSLSESNSTSWNEDQLNSIQSTLAKTAASGIKTIGDFNIKHLMEGFNTLGGDISNMWKDPATRAGIINHFAGQAVSANIMGRNSGQVINSNMELLFNGPRLRTFNFNFKFIPRGDKEAKMIRKIIKIFKRSMAPQRSVSNLFLKSPRIFQLQYIKGANDSATHPFMNKFKPCALTSFNVDYTPDGSYMTYKDGSMTAYSVSMSFNELEPNYADQYGNNDSETTGW